ncbi:phage tail protein [Acinetobacter sp. CS-2]|uniref:phage tail protein n=1 Tax=Acinetobacter sp. CS-2 TaxID=2798861 RepID=UPI001906469D|nr:phage tail protein [Acinetobacter sp. CS-2]QQN40418.1 phage tail protein [Acinetobacter sp. CS-2]
MASQFYNVTTNNGDAKIANAIATATKLNITHVVFGDGNGSVPTPDKSRTALVNQVYSVAPSNYYLHPIIANRLIVEAIIPSDVGGFYIREVGLIADTAVLISDGSVAPIFKEASTDGTREYKLKFAINIVDSGIANITLDSSLVYVTQDMIVDNLTTADARKPLSAAQGKALQDNKLEASKVGIAGGAASLGVDGYVPDDELKKASTTHTGIVQLVNDLVTGGTDKVLTAEQGKIINDKFNAVLGTTGHQKYLSGKIEQWGTVTFPPIASPISSNQTATFTFPFAFPNGVLHVFVTNNTGSGIEGNECTVSVESKTNSSTVLRAYRVASNNAAGNEAFSASVFAIGW